jgi:hypothetical protein
MRNQHFVSFGITSEERDELLSYIKHKKRWASMADLARDAVWQLVHRNPTYAQKKAQNGTNE